VVSLPKPTNRRSPITRTKPANHHAWLARRDSPMLMCVQPPCPQPSGPPSAHDVLPWLGPIPSSL
jgi:hypothetical protein